MKVEEKYKYAMANMEKLYGVLFCTEHNLPLSGFRHLVVY